MGRTTARSRIRQANSTEMETGRKKVGDVVDTMKKIADEEQRLNPLAEMINDETYALLQQHRLIDQKALRDYRIRTSYRAMREEMSSSDAIERLQDLHPYLQFDTIRKIVYMSKSRKAGKKNNNAQALEELIDEETYMLLYQHGLVDQKALRDYQIRCSYREMRERMSASDAIVKLQKMHPQLQFDTIRKIVYMSKPAA